MIRIPLLASALALLAACSATPPQAQRFYQLSAAVPAGSTTPLAQSVGIGPLAWPDYLNRRQLVLRVDAGRLDLRDNDRWAEPLDAGFSRVLRDNLARRLAPRRLQAHPWPLNDAPAIQVPVEVLQFDTDTQGATVLRARWRIVGADRKALAAERVSEIRTQARDGSAAAAVTAQSEALARLGEEIGQSLHEVAR